MKVTAWLPVYASACFELEIDSEEWKQMTDEEKHIKFMAECYPTGGLCHQCAGEINCDMDMDVSCLSEDPQDLEFEEEE